MRIAKGPRPWSIHLFALLFTAQGVYSLYRGLIALEFRQLQLQAQIPAFDWTRDWVIVWQCAWFTIVLIPVIAVWVFASRLARVFVTLMAAASLLALYRFSVLLSGDYPAEWHDLAVGGLTQNAAAIFAVVLLYTGASRRWLRQEHARIKQIFS